MIKDVLPGDDFFMRASHDLAKASQASRDLTVALERMQRPWKEITALLESSKAAIVALETARVDLTNAMITRHQLNRLEEEGS